MCRIFGFSLGVNNEEALPSEIAQAMFPLLTKRGPHSYGWLTTEGTTDSTIKTAKYAGRADTVLATTRMEEIDENARVLIGHTRWATVGSPLNMNNNHPMRHGSIVGVHNGTLTNHDDILRITGRWKDDTQVDSEAIFAAVNRWGHKSGLGKVEGAMVACYTDLRKPHVVSIARSYGRPCVLARTERGNIFWASERQALEALDDALDIKMTWFSGVRDFRLITIRNGKIINRLTYYNPPPVPARIKNYPVARVISHGRDRAMNEYFDAIKEGRDASKYRSEALRQLRADTDEVLATKLVEDPLLLTEDLGLYFDSESGMYVTATEYADMMAQKEGWA